jgi:hypothetical protein
MLGFARLFIVICALIGAAFGLWMAFLAEPPLPFVGLFWAACSLGLIGVLAFERMRYHSESEEVAMGTARSPGGDGPRDALEARFRPTEERFIDPTSDVPMRVYSDPETGERRYRRDDRI